MENFCVDNGYWETMRGNWTMDNDDCTYSSIGSVEGASTWIGYYDHINLTQWTDYSVEWKMTISSNCTGDVGVLFRAQTEAIVNDGGQQVSAAFM